MKFLAKTLFAALSLGTALMMTCVGIPMIWMGEEFGEYKPKTVDPAKLDWSLLKNDENSSLLELVRGLIALRKQTHALFTNNINFFPR